MIASYINRVCEMIYSFIIFNIFIKYGGYYA